SDFETFELVSGYTIFYTLLGFFAIWIFLWLPLKWIVFHFFPDDPKEAKEIIVRPVPPIPKGEDYEE
ncbi:hypothetical protein, partial [Leptospira gomenensis]